jgi:lipopolysaccharide export LptBFGC system permease protein LptF
MIINSNSPVYNTFIVFIIIVSLIHIKKPNLLYDNKKKEYRQFGTTNGKTLLPIYIVGILIAIVLYVFFNHIAQNNVSKKHVSIIETNNTTQQIQQLQTQIQQILQQQIIQQQISNNQHLINNNIKSNISLPNNFNIYD